MHDKTGRPGRRGLLAGAGAAALGQALARPALGQGGAYPNRPIRLVVAYPPGNSSDLVARFVAERMMGLLGQPVVVENRSGAGGTLGTEYVARQPADGYTLGIANAGPLTIAPSLYKTLPYDPLRDFALVAPLAIGSHLFVANPALPVSNIPELIAYARANPGKIFYGSSGNGSAQHLAMALFEHLTGVQMSHAPYRGSGAAMNDLLSGQILLASDTLVSALDLVKTGRLRALGVTSKQRSPFVPEIVPIAEQGVPDYDFYGWIALMAPAGLPQPVLQRLHQAAAAVTAQPDFASRMAQMGLSSMRQSPAELQAFIEADLARWKTVITTAGISIDG